MRLTRLARAAAALMATAGAALWVPTGFFHQLSRTSGLPGETVTVEFGGDVERCEVWFALLSDRIRPCDRNLRATIDIPIATPQRTRLAWRVWRPGAPPAVDGDDFTILQVDVTATPYEVKPGEPITVTFTGRPMLDSLFCRITWPERIPCPAPATNPRSPAPSVRFIAPPTPREGLPFSFRWRVEYRFRGDSGVRDGISTIWIDQPPPVFRARTDPPTVDPGRSLVVAFTSGTAGVTITACGLAYRGVSARCTPSHLAAIVVPSDTAPGTTITVDYDLAYTSTRPREPDNTITNTLAVRVGPAGSDPRPTPGRSPWHRPLGAGWYAALGALVLAALVGARLAARRRER